MIKSVGIDEVVVRLQGEGRSVGIHDVTLVALYKFFKDEAKVSDRQALEAAEAVIRLQGEGRLNEVLDIARESKG